MGQEGVSNLARAFLSSGVTAVLVTSLVRGKEAAVALRDAKLTLMRRFGSNVLPTVAAFQIIGNGNIVVRLGQNRKGLKGAKQ